MAGPVFGQFLGNELQRSTRRGHVRSLLLCKIDQFAKSVKKGRTTLGDEILNVFVKIIKEENSPGDIPR